MLSLLILGVGGCRSEAPLTKEEIIINKRYHREPTENKEYYFRAAGFAVKPPPATPFVPSFVRVRSADGIYFFDEDSNPREPKFYVGRLSTYIYNMGPYDSLNTAVSNIKALIEHCDKPWTVNVVYDSVLNYNSYAIHKFRWVLVNGGTWTINEHAKNQGLSGDSEMIGAIVEGEKGTYLVTLSENNFPTMKYRSWYHCRDGYDEVSAEAARTLLESRFQNFLDGIRFDID